MLYSFADLKDHFDTSTLRKGELCLRSGRVDSPDVRRNGELVTGVVRGYRASLCRVYVRVSEQPGTGLGIRGECSCAERKDCEHVAAVLLGALASEQELRDQGLRDAIRSTPDDAPAQTYPPDVHQRLLYVLHPGPGGALEVGAQSARVGRGDAYVDRKVYQPSWASRGLPPRFLLDIDRELLADLDRLEPAGGPERRRLYGPAGPALLQGLLATGRCLLEGADRPLKLDVARSAKPCWVMDAQGRQTLGWRPELLQVCLLPGAWYLDPASGTCGPVDTRVPQDALERLSQVGIVEAEGADALQRGLSRDFPHDQIPPIRVLELRSLPARPPVPCLTLSGGEDAARACLTFDYQGYRLAEGDPPRRVDGNRLVYWERAPDLEQSCRSCLTGLGFVRGAGAGEWQLDGAPDGWVGFQAKAIPGLRDQGWQVEIGSDFAYPLLECGPWSGEVEDDGADGVVLGLSIELDDQPLALLPVLVGVLRERRKELGVEALRDLDPGHRVPVLLGDGRWLGLPAGRLRKLLEILFELYRHEPLREGRLHLDRFRAPRLLELEETLSLRWPGGEALRERLAELSEARDEPDLMPLGLGARLRDYQREGLAWLQRLRAYGLAGILADDMGLGKTIQTLAHLMLECEQGRADRPSLVVVPTSLLATWRDAVKRFTPDLRLLILHGPRRHEQMVRIPDQDLVLTTYPLLGRDEEALAAQAWHLLVLDEAQHIKNPASQAARLVRALDARHRLSLTGTPLENHLGELWAQLDFLMPGLLGGADRFRRLFRVPIEEWGDEQARERLAQRVRPFLLRRTKETVLPQLPPKTEMVRSVELEGAQRAIYEETRLTMEEQVRQAVAERGWQRSGMVILEALLRLRQVCCDPRLAGADTDLSESAKLALLMDLLPEMIEEGRRVLVFSQFTSMLALIRRELDEVGIPYVELTGRTRDRVTPVERFQSGEVPLFLISLKAGGTGLNLTAADTVIHYDPWWNPAVERQASDRAHRIGQERPVFVYKLICSGTLEERIQALQTKKQDLADGLYRSTGTGGLAWDPDELARLLEPLE